MDAQVWGAGWGWVQYTRICQGERGAPRIWFFTSFLFGHVSEASLLPSAGRSLCGTYSSLRSPKMVNQHGPQGQVPAL